MAKWHSRRNTVGWLFMLAVAAVWPGDAPAQGSVCTRLESQLAQFGNSGVSSAQLARYEQAIAQHQRALAQATAEARQSGCGAPAFLFFQQARPQMCDSVDARIRQIENSLHRLMSERQRMMPRRAGSDDRIRRQILTALAENDCGPQYARYADRRPGDQARFYSFGERVQEPFGNPFGMPSGGTFRTLCVRTCDGYYWPISFSTAQNHFAEDESACQASCRGSEVRLYVHRNPGEGPEDAVSVSGAPYTALPNAFRYRKEYDEGCACRRETRIASLDARAAMNRAARRPPKLEKQGLVKLASTAAVPLPRPRPGSKAAEGGSDLVHTAEDDVRSVNSGEVVEGPDGRKVRVVGSGITYFRRDGE